LKIGGIEGGGKGKGGEKEEGKRSSATKTSTYTFSQSRYEGFWKRLGRGDSNRSLKPLRRLGGVGT